MPTRNTWPAAPTAAGPAVTAEARFVIQRRFRKKGQGRLCVPCRGWFTPEAAMQSSPPAGHGPGGTELAAHGQASRQGDAAYATAHLRQQARAARHEPLRGAAHAGPRQPDDDETLRRTGPGHGSRRGRRAARRDRTWQRFASARIRETRSPRRRLRFPQRFQRDRMASPRGRRSWQPIMPIVVVF